MKKKIFIAAILLALIVGGVLMGTGFTKRTDVALGDFAVSEDGTKMTIYTGLAGSMGYIRDYTAKEEGDGLKVAFYSAFGGFNSSLGAKNEFVLNLPISCTKIYFFRGQEVYDLVLQKDEKTGEWRRV